MAVQPLTPAASAAAVCAALIAALPDVVGGQDERDVAAGQEKSAAAWGDPPIVLRCGVGRPEGLRPTSELLTVNGVDWFPVKRTAGYSFVTVRRAADVELSVPDDYAPEANVLVDLADPLRTHDPVTKRTLSR